MSTNDTDVEETQVTETPEDDEKLRQDLKEALAKDSKSETEETAQETNPETAEAKEEAPAEPEAPLTTQEPEHDLAWYQKAYEESTKEALRLKGELDKKVETPAPPALPAVDDGVVLTPEQLYVRTQLIKESDQAFAAILQKYPDANSPENRERFKQTSEEVSRVIVASEKRFPDALELYEKTAVIMGLTPDNSEALGTALRDSAATPRTASSIPGPAPKSKVTEEMIAMNLKMYPTKTRQQIIEELEPHIT